MLSYNSFINKAKLNVIDPLDLKCGDLFTCRSFFDRKSTSFVVVEFIGFRSGNFIFKDAINRQWVIPKKDYNRYKFYFIGSVNEVDNTFSNLLVLYDVGVMYSEDSSVSMKKYTMIGDHMSSEWSISFYINKGHVEEVYFIKYNSESKHLQKFESLTLYEFMCKLRNYGYISK